MGLREQKKEQTRRLISETAWRLFADRGFDRVSVAEVARVAQVAETTVFNYFRTKEDLFYSGLEGFGAEVVDAVRNRAAGESALAASPVWQLKDRGLWRGRALRAVRSPPGLVLRPKGGKLGLGVDQPVALEH